MAEKEIIDTWNNLSRGAKKVFMKIHELDKKYGGDVFFEIDNLVIWTGYSRRSVFYSLKKLRAIGWVSHLNRPYQCNIYFIWEVLRQYNFTFSRVKIALKLHPIDYLKDKNNFYVQQPSPAAISASPNVPTSKMKEDKKKQWFSSLPIWLQLKFMWESYDRFRYGWVLKKLTECGWAELKNDVMWYISGHKVDKPERFIFERALNIYKKKGVYAI